jgi:hypothetical protein
VNCQNTVDPLSKAVRMRVLVLLKFTDTQRARQTLPMHTSVKNKNTVAQDFIKKIISGRN